MAKVFMKVGENETEFSPMQNNSHPKHLLQRFSPLETTQLSTAQKKKVHEKPADINLGLSLGGIYSAKNTQNSYQKPPLCRSSSTNGILTPKKEPEEFVSPLPKSLLSMARSCSVPTEAEQEQRKAAFMSLAMRTMESSEAFMMGQRNQNSPVNGREKYPVDEPMPTSPSKVAARAAARSPALCRALVEIKRETSLNATRKFEDRINFHTGEEDSTAEKGAIHSQPLPMLMTSASGKSINIGETIENPPKRAKLVHNCFQDNGMDIMKLMPSVTTTGDGPDGRKIEGFLYRYRKGQVSIVCVCHGSFLSPAEFVRHAGGNEFANPMRRITVSSFSF